MSIGIKIIVACVIALIAWISYTLKKKRKLAAEEKERQQRALNMLHAQYDEHLEKNAKGIDAVASNMLSFETCYCAWTDLQNKLDGIKSLVPMVNIPERYPDGNPRHVRYKAIMKFITHAEALRNEHNDAFINREKHRCTDYFKQVLNHPLDDQQIDTIVHDDDNLLVIAGAGCGKTTTVQGKVNYLLDNGMAVPQEILLLSFSKHSVDDLKKKLGNLGVDCRTFHSLSYRVIKHAARAPDVVAPEEAEQIIVDAHRELIGDQTYLSSFTDFALNGLRPIKHENEFESYKSYIDYLKDSEFESLKGMLAKKHLHRNNRNQTLQNEFVKSGQECYIANFLFLNGVEYSYEAPYLYHREIDENERYDKHKKRYRPDFTIYLNGYNETSIQSCPNPENNVLYLEHYGIDEHGNTPKFFDSPAGMSASEYYRSIMEWKDDVHDEYGTVLIKSYSYEFTKKTIGKNLIQQLLDNGVKLVPKTNEEIYSILQEAYSKEIDAIITLVKTFIGLYKSNNIGFQELKAKNAELFKSDPDLVVRNTQLLAIIQRIYEHYQSQLESRRKVDFNDLINEAKVHMEENRFLHPYKYIIVDEFQDISINRYELLNALKKQRYCKFFAVGDDWQSIYRFTGSDLTLFKRFESFFGHTVTKRIETTYRFADPLMSMSSKFILKNPNQAKKTLRPGKSVKTDIAFEYGKDGEMSTNQKVFAILNTLYAEYGDALANKSITLLGRYNHDIDKLEETTDLFVAKDKGYIQVKTVLKIDSLDDQGQSRITEMLLDKRINFLTVHKAKGLESDIVILINCETGKYGFPAELSDDNILNLLLSGDDQYPNGEERRAFYVALTRAKEKFYFLADETKQSKFLREIQANQSAYEREALKCQKCEGDLRFIKDISNKIYGLSKLFGCENYKYGCSYTTFIKPEVGLA